jgi:hypothetical protein
MLTVASLAILIKYQWNSALFAQQGSAAEKAAVASLDWEEMADILADLKLFHQQLLSKDYAIKLHRRLLAACADEETAQMLIGYASTL